MVKRINLTISLFFVIGLFYSIEAQIIEYEAKCREYGRIFKYRCAHLILKSDSTYHYEELAGDLLKEIESGQYQYKGDTLILSTKDNGTLRYIKEKKSLVIYDPDDKIFITRELTMVRKK